MTDAIQQPSRGRRILMLVPYKARDLDGSALVGYYLERRYGHEVIMTNGYDIEIKLLKWAPDAIVFDHLMWGFKARQARMAKDLGMKVIVLPTEGLHQHDDEATQRAGKLHNVHRLADCHFTWGPAVRDLFLAEKIAEEDRVHSVGCPRFDFYRDPYTPLMGTRSELLRPLGVKNPDGPLILWATNTTYVSRSQTKILKRQVRQGKLSGAEVTSLLEDEQVQFREHSRVVLELAQRHPDWNIVIKVHPAEWINPYVALKESAPNIHLAYNVPIFKFIHHCDVLLQRGCTTATEAWMQGKPVLEMEMGQYKNAKRKDFLAGNDIVTTRAEAEAKIVGYLSGSPIPPEQRRMRGAFLDAYYGRIDGRASERSAAEIDRVVSPPSYTAEDQARTAAATGEAHRKWLENEDRRPINRLKDLVGIDRDASLRFWRKLFRREQQDNLGLFIPEIDITREMVDDLHRDYQRILGDVAA